MSSNISPSSNETREEAEITKMLGGQVSEALYWKFKEVASARKENIRVALTHAAIMYIEAGGDTYDGER
jgi:hypothetical protein